MATRNSQTPIEVVLDGKSNARVTQVPVEVALDGKSDARLSQIPLEVIIDAKGNVRLSQGAIEMLLDALPGVHISQIVIEIAAKFIEVPMPLVYPSLPGLKLPVDWDSEHFNVEEKTPAGGKVNLIIADSPIHYFTMSYNFLRNDLPFNEERNLRGFFFAQNGNAGRFLFKNTEDFQVAGQKIGTTDGTNHVFTLVRTYGVGENSGTEPIGFIDLTKSFNLYLDGVLQDKSTYTVDTTIGVQQQIIFNGVPAAGKEMAVDMTYFYYCKFQDPKMSLSRFMRALWSGDKIVIESCRPGL